MAILQSMCSVNQIVMAAGVAGVHGLLASVVISNPAYVPLLKTKPVKRR
jgi:hypothetical protein